MSFTWTFSKLEMFETCPKRFYEYAVAKSVVDTDTSNLDWGNEVHDALRDALKSNKPLPEYMQPYQHWVDKVYNGPGDLYVEQKYGLTCDLSPCPYFSPTVWYRGIADIVRLDDVVGLAIDWKTGKQKDGSDQLGLMALCVFQHYPKVQVVRTEYVWLQDDTTTSRVFKRQEMAEFMAGILPRVERLAYAHKQVEFPPKPSGLCVKYCKVTGCPFHGKGTRG